jgi:hypothetical protein
MEGQGNIEAQDRVTNPRVKMLQDSTCPNLGRQYGVWYTAAPPLNRCWGKLGPGDSFGRMLGNKAPSDVTIGLVNVSISGCNIYVYKKGCPNGLDAASQGIPFNCGYTWLLDLAKKAQQVGVIKGIIFHQGETNNTDPNWKYTVQQIVADLKSDLGLGDIPFLAGELLYAEYGSCCSAHNSEINKLPDLIPNAHVISAAGLPGSDYAHFTSASYRTLGERYAQKMLKLVYNICDSTTIESWYTLNGGTAKQSDTIIVNSGTQLVLSPHPENGLGEWNWTGAGTSGILREQEINTDTLGSYNARVTYTNECNVISRIPVTIVVCDSTITESWYQVNGGPWSQSNDIKVQSGSDLVLRPQAADTIGNWSWTGAGTSGTSIEQNINTSVAGVFSAVATFTNKCGAQSRLPVKITVCDSTAIVLKYQINGSSLKESDTIRISKDATLILVAFPSTGGSWNWTGAGTSGSTRVQTIGTSVPGSYRANITYVNTCGITSHHTIIIIIDTPAGINSNKADAGFIQIYPNPANNSIYFHVQSASGSLHIKEAVITNALGQVVMSINKDIISSGEEISIDKLEAGTYFLRLDNDEGVFVKKFVKIR